MKTSKEIVEQYLFNKDWRVKENSSSPYMYGGMVRYITGEVSKDYWLREVYPSRIAEAYVNGDLHIHDLSGLTIYCCGYSLKDILHKGVRGIPNIPTSTPAKHFDSVLNQIANLVTIFQNEIMGAVAFNGFDTLLAPFIKKDKLDYDEVKQSMQNFIFSINSNSRCGAEPAFSNVTFDLTPPEDMLNEYAVVGGELVSFTYGRCQQEMDMLNRAFFEVMIAGDGEGKLFSYPIPTYNIHSRFDWDNPNNKLLWEMAGKYGIPYFANFINSDLDIKDVRSMCPMPATENVLFKYTEDDEWMTCPIGALYEELKTKPDNMHYVYLKGKFGKLKKATINKFGKKDCYTVTTAKGSNTFSYDHLHWIWDVGQNRFLNVTTAHLNYKEDYICLPYHTEENTIKWEKITSVERSDDNECYCFEVDDSDDPYFVLPTGLITHNCRLKLDLRELRHRNGGLFGAGDSTGSIGVVTINLPRLGYLHKGDKKAFFDALDNLLEISKDSLEIKRKWLQENVIDTNLLPAYMEYVGTLDNHFSTIGIVGMNEMCENFMGKDIRDDEAHAFCLEVGNFIRERLIKFQEETGHLYNYEATPAESTCYRLAKMDKEKYPDIITQENGGDVYYTNSCHIPVKYITTIDSTFAHQNDLQQQFTGGTVIHCYLDGAITGAQAEAIVKEMFTKYGVPYMSLSPISRYCYKHGYIVEHVDECPYCRERLRLYQRITGYLRCVDNFNPGKAGEFRDRKQLLVE